MQPNRACQRVSSNTVDSVTIRLHRTSTLDVSRALQCQHDLMFPESSSFNFYKSVVYKCHCLSFCPDNGGQQEEGAAKAQDSAPTSQLLQDITTGPFSARVSGTEPTQRSSKL